MLVYKKVDNLDVIGYSHSILLVGQMMKIYISMLVGGVISWKSVKQTLKQSSTMKTRFVACYRVASHVNNRTATTFKHINVKVVVAREIIKNIEFLISIFLHRRCLLTPN
ncbi:hypothetical protein CR513_62797, partial [Mucuna pruriens]